MATNLSNRLRSVFIMLLSFLSTGLIFAQDKGADLTVDVNTHKTTTTEWYTNPTYLIIGGVVLIIIIALIMRGGGSKN
ncbi:hypothetical protein G6R40_10705 [Chryseobacterium sp. POL2]|uniref:hypothetical protein n=1 Tax=Chryseobacterium sp. POL2 TaxID=2713414 RepID=UPI0013E1F53E|nr:hypothetical protein [Chryseobacterium sp. POL2]QIG90099.1 hypothetical protein G6R40_10705 [Chryseobacterium sp. POL2]